MQPSQALLQGHSSSAVLLFQLPDLSVCCFSASTAVFSSSHLSRALFLFLTSGFFRKVFPQFCLEHLYVLQGRLSCPIQKYCSVTAVAPSGKLQIPVQPFSRCLF